MCRTTCLIAQTRVQDVKSAHFDSRKKSAVMVARKASSFATSAMSPDLEDLAGHHFAPEWEPVCMSAKSR